MFPPVARTRCFPKTCVREVEAGNKPDVCVSPLENQYSIYLGWRLHSLMNVEVRGVLEDVPEFTFRQWILLVTPFVLIASMYFLFNGLVSRFGYSLGFSLGMIVYWVLWCIALPLALLGPGEFVDLFREAKPRLGGRPRLMMVLLLWPLPFPLLFRFLPRIGDATVMIILVSIAVGIAIGITEEILWRGTYVRLFPTSLTLGFLFPAILFGLWHLAPASIHEIPFPGAPYSFVLYALVLGLSYGYYAFHTGSIRWCTVSHIVHDSLGMAGATFIVLVEVVG